MKLLHFSPQSTELRFLKALQRHLRTTYEPEYIHFQTTRAFLRELDSRKNHTDIILITAHGSPEYIIGDQVQGQLVKLRVEDLKKAKNSFVFAFSCSTSEIGNKLCSNHQVIAYIGFNDVINLTPVTGSTAFKDELSRIIKGIYVEAMKNSLDEFFQKNYSAGQLKSLISLNMKRSYTRILGLSPHNLAQCFSLQDVRVNTPAFSRTLHSDLLTTIHAVSSRVELYGEKDFIPWVFISNDQPAYLARLAARVEQSSFSDKNLYYKHFLLAYLYMKLNKIAETTRNALLARTLNPDYEPLMFVIDPKIQRVAANPQEA